jgi:hypothetical protein
MKKKIKKRNTKKEGKKKKQVVETNHRKLTRGASITKALQLLKTAKKEDILKRADELFTQGGGKSNLRETAFTATHVFNAFIAAGILEKDKDAFNYKLQ